MCPTQIKLTEQCKSAESAYRAGIARMKEMRGQDFERVWQAMEHRRKSLERIRRTLREHEMEHSCGSEKCFAAMTR
jgi:hypothetical protein